MRKYLSLFRVKCIAWIWLKPIKDPLLAVEMEKANSLYGMLPNSKILTIIGNLTEKLKIFVNLHII